MKTFLKSLARGLGYEIRNLRPYPRDDWAATLAHLPWKTPFATLIDVGANEGQTSLRLRSHFPGAVIHAFEPCAATHAILAANVGGRSGIHAHRLAMGDRTGAASLVHADNSQLHTLRKVADDEGGEREPVEVARMDDFACARGLGRIDLLKTDTEGYDAHVLRGASRLLADRAVAAVLSEFTLVPSDRTHTQLQDLNAILYPAGFKLYGVYELVHWSNELQYGNALYVHPAFLREPSE